MHSKSLETATRPTGFRESLDASEPHKKPDLFDHLEAARRALLVSEVAELLRVSQRQVYKLAASREIPSLKIAGCIRFDGVVLATWLRRNSGGAQ